ncbi:cysteine and histidine-rich protein 1 isoform X3 [Phocoena sinus]|uniref:cysteine and histidine-rich protein 1 isoform X3 n=1 Tax=Phocoena sinus TaxID=42100 RepID=UPI0013C4221E|nr:cysteine and histidine-rich protein 1 isoform X3 [Phocoena sinus]
MEIGALGGGAHTPTSVPRAPRLPCLPWRTQLVCSCTSGSHVGLSSPNPVSPCRPRPIACHVSQGHQVGAQEVCGASERAEVAEPAAHCPHARTPGREGQVADGIVCSLDPQALSQGGAWLLGPKPATLLQAHAAHVPCPGPSGPPRQPWLCATGPWEGPLQCTNGHLMCAGCFIHLLADARLKEEQATCPNCRCEISKSLCCRNLAVEKAVSELPSECGFCLCQFPRSLLERHQKEECQDRVTQCKYKRIGCPWHGPFHELTVHEAACAHPTKTGNELMEILDEMDQSHRKEMQLYNSIFSLLSFEKIGYTGGYCGGHGLPEASEKMVRAGAPERAEGARLKLLGVDAQGWAGWTAPRPTGSLGLSWLPPLPLDTLGSRAWSRHRE